MRCIYCGGATFVTNSATNSNNTFRIRKCKRCGKRYGTKEIFVPLPVSTTQISIIKTNIRENKEL